MLQLPKVIGHRGAMAYVLENTLASFREAHKRGAPWIEIDVKLTSDGVPVVMHDESLKRTMGVEGLVAKMTRAELPKDVPTFEDTIALCAELGLGCNVEIKPCAGRESETGRVTVEALRKYWKHAPPPFLSSFKDASLVAARDAAPEYARAVLIDKIGEGSSSSDWQARAKAVDAAGINTNGKFLTAPQVVAIKAAGYALSAYTINEAPVAKVLIAMGVDCIITDVPDVLVEALS
jgi:glycerophosphoryl diester phosphodiesterase